ncbi:F0F1 ATP synthase subunit B family protein [Varunaivibrio sulfuroxidans]|uniref:ATP synthase subunit b n=1 Tax=Varunaivibrio sulfuroxidans TaxID=1773489 RepID=A0A4R3JAV9_9PROT|nr:F0F1 ATP synthase subunit B' [Varunaivibrio sulfuroxidans]TCS62206.1 F-type H+-transporting ATPase subunit b [Varunaivibrio sulfuroxidans]WES30631.1 F0F1 ATP synthase subunit B' [Varunaivibrio sulfuroxidans]
MRILSPASLLCSGSWRSGFWVLALALGFPAEAFAATLPQLEVAMFPPQIVWLVISFVVLYILMAKVALPRIGEVLEERQNRVDDNLAKAQTLNDAAETAKEAYEKALSEARSKAQGDLRAVRERADREAANQQTELSEKLKATVLQSEKEIAASKAEAIAGVRDVAVDVAGVIVEKLIGEAPGKATLAKAVDSFSDA